MATNRCKLTSEGLEAVNALLEALGYDRFPGTGTTKIRDLTSLDRGTINHIFKRDKAVNYNSLEKLFQRLNSQTYFERNPSQKKDFCYRYYCEVEKPPRPRCRGSLRKRAEPTLSNKQKLAKSLWELNCDQQVRAFEDSLKKLAQGGMFLVRAQDLQVQRWLVKRLSAKIHNSNTTSKILPPIEITNPGQSCCWSWEKGALWQEFRLQDKPPNSDDEAIKQLCELAKDGPVVIALFGFERLKPNIQEQLLNFWEKLQSSFNQIPQKSIRSKIVFFVSGTTEIDDSRFKPAENVTNSSQAIALPALLEISKIELRSWLTQDIPYLLLEQKVNSSEQVDLLIEDHSIWRSSPLSLLNEVCFTLHDSMGFAAFESYWKLDWEQAG